MRPMWLTLALLFPVFAVGCGSPPAQNTAGQPTAPDPNQDPKNKPVTPPKGAGEMPGNLKPTK